LEINNKMEVVNQYCDSLDNYVTKDIRLNCYAVAVFFYFYLEILQMLM